MPLPGARSLNVASKWCSPTDDAMHATTTVPLLEVRGLCKQFPGVVALDRVEFRAYPHEVHALIGENGAGKSTLLKILAGVLAADAGEILIEGRPVRLR